MIKLDEIESTGLAEAIRLMKNHITFSTGVSSISDITFDDKFFILGVMSWIHAQWPHVSK